MGRTPEKKCVAVGRKNGSRTRTVKLGLRKLPRGWNQPNGRLVEPLIEALTLHVAAEAGIRVATGHLARWTIGHVPVTGLISRQFTGDEIVLVPGSAAIAVKYQDYRAARHEARVDCDRERRLRAMATMARTLAVLRDFDLATEFATHLFFDAWIGNGDRHPENWGILIHYTRNRVELAPMYDTAGCLGSELPDEALPDSETAIDGYIARCKSGFGDGVANPGTAMREIIKELRASPEWQAVAPGMLSEFTSYTGGLPDDARS